jgi:NTE family protein
MLATAWGEIIWEDDLPKNFHEKVFEPTMRLTASRADVGIIALGLIPFINPADHLARWLDRRWLHGFQLKSLPDRPRFVINAASLATGVSWRFSKQYMGDSRIGVVCAPELSLARAIAASAAFPPFVSPLVLDLSAERVVPVAGADLLSDPRYVDLRRRVLLLDGGAYDNLGIESVEGRCRIVLASDAGGNLKVDPRHFRYRFWWPQVRRTLDLAVEGGRAQRRRALIGRAGAAWTYRQETGKQDPKHVTEHVALWRTSFDLRTHKLLPGRWPIAEGWREHLSTLPTRIWPMAPSDRDHLVNWGYLNADVMLRSWVPQLEAHPEPLELPIPRATFERSP